MAQQGDDCYFFYYSICSKGDMCPFRHCAAALGNETVCSLWQDGCCTRRVCKFRHMEIKKDRSLEQCYWETQPGGCTKPHCAFRHTKSDDILPASNHTVERVTVPHTTIPASSLAESFDRLIAKPLEMKVKKRLSVEEEQIPSPIVQPVVINPLSDESDAESSSGHTPVKKKPPIRLKEVVVPSQPTFIQTRRSSDTTDITDVNVEIKSLEQIRMEKLARAKAQLAEFGELEDYLVEDEEDQRFIQDEVPTVSSRISLRLGPSTEDDSHDSPPARHVISQPIKASKSQVVHPKLAPPPIPQTRIKPPPGQNTKAKIGIKKSKSRNPVNIGVRTLAEIKKSKLKQNDVSDKLNDDRIAKRRIAIAETGVSIREKRLLNQGDDEQIDNEDEDRLQMGRTKRQKIDISKRLGTNKNSQEKVAAETVEVKVKSLDEIRREKALLSMQKKKQGTAPSNGDNTDVDIINKLESETTPKQESESVPVEQIKIKTLAQIREEKKKSSEKPVEIKIKTLEEIRQEKALRLGDVSNDDLDTSPRSDVKKQKISVKKVLPRVRQLYQPPKSRDAETSSKSLTKKESQLDEYPGNTSPVKPNKKFNTIWSKKPDSSRTAEVDAPKSTETKSTNEIKIKTFAEIMAEKKQRQKEMTNSSAASEADPKPSMKRKFTPVVFDLDAKGSGNTVGPRSTSQQNISKITPSSKPVGAVAGQTRKIKLNKNIAKVMPRTSAEANNQENNGNLLSSSMSSNKDVTTTSIRTNLSQDIVTSSTDNDTQEKLVTSSKTSSVSVEPEISNINSKTPSDTVDSTPTPSTPSPSVQTPPRALSPRVSSSTSKRKISPSVSRQQSNSSDSIHSAEKKSRNLSSNADDDLDQLLNEIGDDEGPVPLEESKSADDLLLELEELLE